MLTAVLLIGLALGLFGRSTIDSLVVNFNKLKGQLAMAKAFRKKDNEMKAMRERGEFNEWRDLPDGAGGTLTVCIKTGWCPSLKGFIPMERIKKTLDDLKLADEYKLFRNDRLIGIAQQFDLDFNKMEEITESIFSMKKDFYLMKVAQLQSELKQKADDVNTEKV